VTINNQWSELYTVIEVSAASTGRACSFQLTTASCRNSISTSGSAHVATFRRARPRTCSMSPDLLGAQINAPTRQAAIRSTLLHLLATDETATQPAA